MTLLDSTNEVVTVFLEVRTVDADGNPLTKPSVNGVESRARIWQLSSTEKQDTAGVNTRAQLGVSTRAQFGLRFPRSFPHVVGARSQVEWNGKRYSVVGDPIVHNGSVRTRHLQYLLERS
jgi:hypothetical protein